MESLWALVGNQLRENYASNKEGKAPVIDVVIHGFFKVLGRGNLPKQPVIIKARFFSKLAEKKLRMLEVLVS